MLHDQRHSLQLSSLAAPARRQLVTSGALASSVDVTVTMPEPYPCPTTQTVTEHWWEERNRGCWIKRAFKGRGEIICRNRRAKR